MVNALYNIVDQIFIGWGVGYLGNGATNIVFPITIIALALAVLVGDGAAAFFSLKLGEGDKKSVKKGVGNAIVMVMRVLRYSSYFSRFSIRYLCCSVLPTCFCLMRRITVG